MGAAAILKAIKNGCKAKRKYGLIRARAFSMPAPRGTVTQ
jgi:hypothetical protein